MENRARVERLRRAAETTATDADEAYEAAVNAAVARVPPDYIVIDIAKRRAASPPVTPPPPPATTPAAATAAATATVPSPLPPQYQV